MKIAILGGTSHIAKGLIYNFLQQNTHELILFVRSEEQMIKYLTEINCDQQLLIKNFSELNSGSYDVLINCIGIKISDDPKNNLNSIFRLTEYYDDLVIDYLLAHPKALYINFSSGAAYGTDFSQLVDEKSSTSWQVNNLPESAYYGIAKLNSEAKHRSQPNLNIVDLRIFGYFSRFIDLQSKYFLAELISCLKNNKLFITNSENIVRDYLHPTDLFSLVNKCMIQNKINSAFDAYSKKPVTKFEVIEYCKENYGLKYEVQDTFNAGSITGNKCNYYSINTKAKNIGYQPQYSSLEGIIDEARKMLVEIDKK